MKTDICFISSPNYWTSTHLPYSFLQLSAWLDKEGISSEIVDIKRNKWFHNFIMTKNSKQYQTKKIIDAILKIRPRFIGFSVFITDYVDIIELARRIKEAYDVPMIVGNAHSTLFPEDFLFEGSPIDYVVIGEGEVTLTELIASLKSNKPVSDIEGIAFVANGAVTVTKPREMLPDLSVLPMPSYGKVDMDFYVRPTKYLIRGSFTSGVAIFSGRGCPFNCTFCASNAVWKKNVGAKSVRFRPVDKVIEEIVYLKERYKIDGFYIMDDTFTIDRKRVIDFCNKLIGLNLNLVWACQARVNLIEEETVKLMKKAGCVQLEFGVETGSPKLLKEIKKAITVPEIERAFRLCKNLGIRTFANMLVNLPTETKEDLRMTERLMERIDATFYGFGITAPYPGCELFDRYFKSKITVSDYFLFNDRRANIPEFKMAQHSLNLAKLIDRWNKMFKSRGNFDFIKVPAWRKSVFSSRRKLKYVHEFFKTYLLLLADKIVHRFTSRF